MCIQSDLTNDQVQFDYLFCFLTTSRPSDSGPIISVSIPLFELDQSSLWIFRLKTKIKILRLFFNNSVPIPKREFFSCFHTQSIQFLHRIVLWRNFVIDYIEHMYTFSYLFIYIFIYLYITTEFGLNVSSIIY